MDETYAYIDKFGVKRTGTGAEWKPTTSVQSASTNANNNITNESMVSSGSYTNPITGQVVDMAKQAPKTVADLASQGFIPGVAAGNKTISQGTDQYSSLLGKSGEELTKAIEDMYKTGGTPTNSTELDLYTKNITDSYNKLKTTTSEELAQIDAAGLSAGQGYDQLISEAQASKKSGMGKAVVGAGERGGFMSTQYSGIGALIPTEGGSFVGTGGELNRIKSEYDMNINKLQVAKNQAIDAAKAAARVALQTGKQKDFDNAKTLLDTARQAQQDSQDLIDKKINTILNIQAGQRANTTSMFNIMKDIPAGKTIKIGNDTFEGISQPEAFWTSSSLVSLMQNLPVGQKQEITDPNTKSKITITGLKQETPDTQIFHSVDENNGNETYTTIDKATGKILKQVVSKGTGSRYKLGGDGSGTNTKEQDKFYTSLDSARNDLRMGETWGAVYNTLYSRYATGNAEQDKALSSLIDNSLGKDVWAKGGAYQEFKKSTGAGKKAIGSQLIDSELYIVYDDGSKELSK